MIMVDTLLMESTTFRNVREVLRRTVRSDGRCGGLQRYIDQEVDILIYNEENEDN